MPQPPPVAIRGLDDFRRDLRRAGGRVSDVMGEVNKRVADRLVVSPAKSRAQGQPGATGKLAEGNAIRAARRQKAAVVVIGGARQPWALGGEFGAKQFRQFQPWRGNQFEGLPGYAVHPTIRDNRSRIEDTYLDELHDQVRRAAFPD